MSFDEVEDTYNFLVLMRALTNRAITARNKFLATERPEPLIDDFVRKICEFYHAMAFFPHDRIKQKFFDLGISPERLIWLISIENIMTEIENIEKTGKIRVYKAMLVKLVDDHLQVKILKEMAEEFQLMRKHKGKFIPSAALALKNAIRRKRESGRPPKLFIDETHFNVHKSISNFSKFDEQFIQGLCKGDSKILLGHIKDCFREIKPVPKREFSRIVYNFYRIILPDDKTWYSEDEFYEHGPEEARNFHAYQHTKVINTLDR